MLCWSNEQVSVQTKDTKHSVYVVPQHMTTIPYSADLHADFPRRTFVEHAAAVRHHYSVSLLQLFIVGGDGGPCNEKTSLYSGSAQII